MTKRLALQLASLLVLAIGLITPVMAAENTCCPSPCCGSGAPCCK